jgi:hypothetical protein
VGVLHRFDLHRRRDDRRELLLMAAALFDQALDIEDGIVDLGPATAVALGLVGAALAANAWLLYAGHAPLTALARSPQGRAFRAYFDRHVDGALFVDLFSIGGRAVSRLPRRLL